MTSDIFSTKESFDKNINFLIGSGASADYIPTLKLVDETSYETLLEQNKNKETVCKFILFNYYINIIQKAFCLQPPPDNIEEINKISSTFESYLSFIVKLIQFLERKQQKDIHRANIFTTNYDIFFERCADQLNKTHNFILNDGSTGLIKRFLSISNFHLSVAHQGTLDNYRYEIPMLNLIKVHGSISWKKENSSIFVEYPHHYIQEIDSLLSDVNNSNVIEELKNKWSIELFPDFSKETFQFSKEQIVFLDKFINEYNKIAIVNPTKKKFEETVFQQHYYQCLRLLSYELEKPQTLLICFGFSFADEHIREIVKRSLSNKQLIVYIFCLSTETKVPEDLINFENIKIIKPSSDEEKIDFTKFISYLFNSNEENKL
ncbi:SIR2 family protein [Gilliamella sp. WF3-4]|jgi:hypothetical protein|uniref:SIR2 family protein n=1 Tax=Gilliamella sp. WF3-4 TaxID=3120255 RepID=UPI00080E682D|nr:SIR2 family protein [Gilliamella apicola]OCG17221.1 hypothetical protein A9G47_08870 [Gilliamella apicola]